MNNEAGTQGRRVIRRTSAEDRERLIGEFEKSGLTRKAFCEERGLVLTTFHGWFKKRPAQGRFVEVAVGREVEEHAGEIEIELANGTHVWIRPGEDSKGLAELVRGVAGC